MEGRKQVGSSSSSSFTTDLFGSKDSSYPSSSSTGIFASIFSTSSKVLGRESLRPDLTKKKQDSGYEVWNAKPGTTENALQHGEGESQSISYRDTGSFYQEQRVQPCHLSSSIYYGGQDVYAHPQNTQSSGIQSMGLSITKMLTSQELTSIGQQFQHPCNMKIGGQGISQLIAECWLLLPPAR